MLTLTYANKDGGLLSLLQADAINAGLDFVVLGWGEQYGGWTSKLKAVYRAIETTDAAEIILFVDGYDVRLMGTEAAILARYEAFAAPLVMSAETACNPYPELVFRYPDECQAPYPYLNSGGYIGTAGAIRELLSDLRVWRLPDAINDQGVLSDFYLSHPGRICLDHRAELFQSLYGAEDHIYIESGRARNLFTDSRPLLLHGNGGASQRFLATLTTGDY